MIPTRFVDICSLPEAPGQCLAYMPRWAYNPAVSACAQFIYGGCGGNRNRFLTEEACLERCSSGGGRVTESSSISSVGKLRP